MDVQEVLRNLGLILGAGLCAGPIAVLLRVPQMIVLVAIGALIGPSALGIVENPLTGLGAQLIFTVGVSLILFHGGTGSRCVCSRARRSASGCWCCRECCSPRCSSPSSWRRSSMSPSMSRC